MRQTLFALPAFLIFLIPGVAEAQLVACTGLNCGTCEFVTTLNNAVGFLVAIASIIATIILVYAALRLVTSGGNDEAREFAKRVIWNIILGLLLVIAAFAIINVMMLALLPSGSPVLPWQTVQCINAIEPKVDTTLQQTGGTVGMECTQVSATQFDCSEQIAACEAQEGTATVNTDDATQHTVQCDLPGSAFGGSCDAVTDQNNACHEDNLDCFGNTSAASQVCNLESAGGQTSVMSGSDKCKDGSSFSGGLWQINILANGSRVPGCSGNFYSTAPSAGNACDVDGNSAQGGCLECKTNSNGVRYCAQWNCQITNRSAYDQCVNQIQDPAVNTQVACELYGNGGWDHWRTSANTCNVI